MNLRRSSLVFLTASYLLGFGGGLYAQGIQRVFPENSFLGFIEFGMAPEVLVDGQPNRLAPGSLIRNTNNLIVTPNQAPSRAWIKYTKDHAGQVHLAWILTDEEFRRERARR